MQRHAKLSGIRRHKAKDVKRKSDFLKHEKRVLELSSGKNMPLTKGKGKSERHLHKERRNEKR